MRQLLFAALCLALFAFPARAQQQVPIVSGVVTLDLSGGVSDFAVNVTAPITSFGIQSSNPFVGGQRVTVIFTQDATGHSVSGVFACSVSGSANAVTACVFVYNANTAQWATQGGGTGGSMTWPGGAAGIPNYNGASGWGTSYSASNQLPANFIPTLNQNTTGNAATATNLASYPTLCAGAQFSQGLSSGSNNCAAPALNSSQPADQQTAASFSIPSTDFSGTGFGTILNRSNASAMTDTLTDPTAAGNLLIVVNCTGTALFNNGVACAAGTSTDTITRGTAAVFYGADSTHVPTQGGTTMVVPAGQKCPVVSTSTTAWYVVGCETLTPSAAGGAFAGTVTYTTSTTAGTSDNSKLVVMNCSAACAYTLPATQPSTTWQAWVISVGSTLATVALGGADTFNGSTTAPLLLQNRTLFVAANTQTSTDYKGDAPLDYLSSAGTVSRGTATSTTASGNMKYTSNGRTSIGSANGNSMGITTGYDISQNVVGNSSGTVTVRCDLGTVQDYTLTAAVTGQTFTNCVSGSYLIFTIRQGATGFAWTWAASVKGGMAVSTTANSVNVQAFYFDGTNYQAINAGVTH